MQSRFHPSCRSSLFFALSRCVSFSPLYDQYCKDHYADGHCDQGCNNAECDWDGLDCAENVPEKRAEGHLVLVVQLPPEQLRNNSSSFLRELSRLLHTNVVFRLDLHGELMIYPYYGSTHELKKHNIKRSLDSRSDIFGSSHHDQDSAQVKR